MSDKQKSSIVLDKTNIKDIIAESRLIREFSMYGCEESPGKLFGYNPVSNKCVDITGYDGPEAPMEVPKVPGIKKKADSVLDLVDPRNLVPFLKDVYLGAFDIEQIKDCALNNPAFSGLGFIVGASNTGKSIVMLLPRVAISAVTPKGLKQSIATERSLKSYRMKHLGRFSQISQDFLKVVKNIGGKFGKLAAVTVGLAGVGFGAFKGFFDYQEKKDVMSFLEWVENEAWGSESLKNFKCLGAAAVLSVALGALGRSGTSGLLKLTGKTLAAPVAVPTKIIKAILQSNSMKNMLSSVIDLSLKGVSAKNLKIFKELQSANLISNKYKLVLDSADGVGALKVVGLPGDLRIPANKVPASLKGISGEGDLILKKSDLDNELAEISKNVNKNLNDQIQGSAASFGSSPYQKQLKLFKQVLKKTGNLSPKAINSQAFENSIELLSKMHEEALELSKKLSVIEKDLLKQRSFVERTVKNISTSTGLPNIKKVESLILNGKLDEVESILSKSYPGLAFKSPEAFKGLKDYFTKFKDFDLTQKELISQLELGKKALLDDTGLLKSILGDKNSKDGLENWLATSAGQKWASTWNSFPSKRINILKSITSTPLKNAFSKFLASEDLMIVGAAGAAASIANLPKAEIDNTKELQDIVGLLEAELENINLEDLYDENTDKINAQKLILSLISSAQRNKRSYSEETQFALNEWEKAAQTDKKYISKIDQYINRTDLGKPTPDDLKIRTRSIIRGTLTPKGGLKEVLQMSKKDIRQLVAEVLNEGYGKYPYNANEPSEGEPDEDYMVEWKALVDEVCDNKKKNVDGDPNTFDDATIEVAKILVKDQDLFRDVLEMAGSNKSIGVEIMQQLKAAREKKNLDKELDV